MSQLLMIGGGASALTVLPPWLAQHEATAAVVPENDPRLNVASVFFDSPYGRMNAYTVRLTGSDRQPSVLVIHDDHGLTPSFQALTRRLAAAGFYAMAVDALSPLGGTSPEVARTEAAIPKLDRNRTVEAFQSAIRWLKTNLNTTDKIGCIGYGWGGALANDLATRVADLSTTVVYYGASPSLSRVPNVKSAMLLHYASDDPQVNPSVPAYIDALKRAGIRQSVFRYAGTKAGFADKGLPETYNEAAAKLAWSRSMAFFKTMLP